MQEKGRKVPLLDDLPELSIMEAYYLAAFQDLNSCRPHAAGADPISVQEIYFYCKLKGITDQEEVEDIFSMVKFADNVFMSWNAEAAKKGK